MKQQCICGNIATEDTKYGKICKSCKRLIKLGLHDSATMLILEEYKNK